MRNSNQKKVSTVPLRIAIMPLSHVNWYPCVCPKDLQDPMTVWTFRERNPKIAKFLLLLGYLLVASLQNHGTRVHPVVYATINPLVLPSRFLLNDDITAPQSGFPLGIMRDHDQTQWSPTLKSWKTLEGSAAVFYCPAPSKRQYLCQNVDCMRQLMPPAHVNQSSLHS